MTQRPYIAYIATIAPPQHYTPEQLRTALRLAHALNRGRLILTEPPRA